MGGHVQNIVIIFSICLTLAIRCVSFRREYCESRGGPNGGNGSKGGSIFLVCDKGLNSLATLHKKVHCKAENGMVSFL